jgi:IS66 C-terminal element
VRSTAKANKLDLYGYLRRLFYSIPGGRSVEHFERLLPFQQPVTSRKHQQRPDRITQEGGFWIAYEQAQQAPRHIDLTASRIDAESTPC